MIRFSWHKHSKTLFVIIYILCLTVPVLVKVLLVFSSVSELLQQKILAPSDFLLSRNAMWFLLVVVIQVVFLCIGLLKKPRVLILIVGYIIINVFLINIIGFIHKDYYLHLYSFQDLMEKNSITEFNTYYVTPVPIITAYALTLIPSIDTRLSWFLMSLYAQILYIIILYIMVKDLGEYENEFMSIAITSILVIFSILSFNNRFSVADMTIRFPYGISLGSFILFLEYLRIKRFKISTPLTMASVLAAFALTYTHPFVSIPTLLAIASSYILSSGRSHNFAIVIILIPLIWLMHYIASESLLTPTNSIISALLRLGERLSELITFYEASLRHGGSLQYSMQNIVIAVNVLRYIELFIIVATQMYILLMLALNGQRLFKSPMARIAILVWAYLAITSVIISFIIAYDIRNFSLIQSLSPCVLIVMLLCIQNLKTKHKSLRKSRSKLIMLFTIFMMLLLLMLKPFISSSIYEDYLATEQEYEQLRIIADRVETSSIIGFHTISLIGKAVFGENRTIKYLPKHLLKTSSIEIVDDIWRDTGMTSAAIILSYRDSILCIITYEGQIVCPFSNLNTLIANCSLVANTNDLFVLVKVK